MSLIIFLVVGLIAGFLASYIMGRQQDLLVNLLIGVVGAVVGGLLAGLVGIAAYGLIARSSLPHWVRFSVFGCGSACAEAVRPIEQV